MFLLEVLWNLSLVLESLVTPESLALEALSRNSNDHLVRIHNSAMVTNYTTCKCRHIVFECLELNGMRFRSFCRPCHVAGGGLGED